LYFLQEYYRHHIIRSRSISRLTTGAEICVLEGRGKEAGNMSECHQHQYVVRRWDELKEANRKEEV
jgi:hypothetical protein